MTEGILNINKPSGWTSQDVCAKLRNRLHIKKIGHTGTLDPMATGVLPVCVGKATRIIEYYDNDLKTYHASMRLGYISDTLDVWGNVSVPEDIRALNDIDAEEIRACFKRYTGTVTQIPPKYSALRINGKRAYDLAREGHDFELCSREITITSNEITRLDTESGEIEFDVTCSKGTYIRTICDDIGRSLGCGGIMTALERTASGCFRISDSTDVRDVVGMSDEEIEKLIIPMELTLEKLGTIILNDNRVIAFINGNSSGRGFSVAEETDFALSAGDKHAGCGVYKIFNKGIFLGTGIIAGEELIPAKVLSR